MMEMAYCICIFPFLVLLQIQLITNQDRYCQEAVNSVENVEFCPTSKTEWDRAATKKNCSRIAPQQNCVSAEKFKYHCVINGYRNKLVEVCAPARIIFGHCVEFNVRGGVIQDQMSAPCNKTFPMCGSIYSSSDAYKYPDCYKLVSMSEVRSSTKLEPTSPIRTATNEKMYLNPTAIGVIVAVSLLLLISIGAIVSFELRKNGIGESKEAKLGGFDSKQEHRREVKKVTEEYELKTELNSILPGKIRKQSENTSFEPLLKD